MTFKPNDLIDLVEKLRQEQEFVQFYKSQICQGFQELNVNCDEVFHSLWLTHTLSNGLQRVLTHNVQCYEWSLALDQVANVEFVNASKALPSQTFVEPYSKFLSSILSDPETLSEILYIAEAEGLDCQRFVSDLVSVVFGHCIFQRDHTLFLHLLRELIKQHIRFCDSPKDLFGGVESVFNKVLAEYCSQLVELKTFLTELLQEPVMGVLVFDEFLEYDVHKAVNRFQADSDQNPSAGLNLVDTNTFLLFGEDLDLACEKLSTVVMLILEKLSKMNTQFPVSLKWLLKTLKSLAQDKWPNMTQAELRRLTGDAVFGTILSAAIVNPDNHAVVESAVVVGGVARYNLTQVTTVLQRASWTMDKQSIHRVIKNVDMTLYYSVLDSFDGNYGDDIPVLPSSLPGLRRSAFLASQIQLNNLVGLMATILTHRIGRGTFHTQMAELLSCLPRPLIDLASTSPYSMHTMPNTQTRPPLISLKDGTISIKKVKVSEGSKGRAKKRGTMSNTNSVDPLVSVSRSKSIGALTTAAAERGGNRFSPPNDSTVSGSSGLLLPTEVLILPFLDVESEPSLSAERWGFHLLSEDEFMGRLSSPSKPSVQTPDRKELQKSLEQTSSQSPVLTGPTSPVSTAPRLSVPHSQPMQIDAKPHPFKLQSIHPDLSSSTPGRLSVKDIVNKIEGSDEVPRSRSHTLPNPDCTYKRNYIHSEVTGPSTISNDSPGNRPEPLSPLSPEIVFLGGEFDHSPTSANPYDKLISKDRPYIASSSSSLANSPQSVTMDTMNSFLYEPPVIDPLPVSNGLATPTIWTFPGVSSSEVTLDAVSPIHESMITDSQDKISEYEMSQEVVLPPSISKKAAKKRKIFGLFRKSKSTDKQSKSNVKLRSKSDMSCNVIHSKEAQLKTRSMSENDEASSLRRSYTLLTADITAKYAKKHSQLTQLREAKVSEYLTTNGTHNSTPNTSVQLVPTPPAEMSTESFQKSLYGDQLKYKLRAALQNIHTPLSLSPFHCQLADNECDTRYQLILLIQHALQRSRWRHDSMEVALLTEILKMVEPLSNELVQAAVEGVYSDYSRRSAYIAYLVQSQQKFHDAKLQVAAFQSSVNRIKEIDREIFVNFAVQLFLEGRNLVIKQFSQDISTLQLADEKCSLMERHQLVLGEAIQDDPTWLCWGDMDGVISCLDDHLFTHVYEHVFYPNDDSDTMRDQIFSSHLTHLSETVSVTHKSLQIPLVYHNSCPWLSAQAQLQAMAAYRSPRGKVCCIVQCCKVLISLLQLDKCGDPPGADDMFPVIVYVIIKANPPGLLSTIQFIRNFIETRLVSEDAYWWAQFSTAIEFTKTLE